LTISKIELKHLLNKSKNGDPSSFRELSKNIRDISYSYFLSKHRLKKIVNLEDVEDLTNNVYLAFAEQYHNVENIENWIRRVLFLTFIRWYKQNRSTKIIELNENITSGKSEDTTDLLDLDLVMQHVERLSDEKQKIIKMRFWGDLKFQEIAEKMNKSEAAIKKMFYRALLEVKNKLE